MHIVPLNIQEIKYSKKKLSVCCKAEKLYMLKLYGIIRGMIKKSYGTTVRPAVIYFQDNVHCKATCRCPVGLSGVCCHILALLLYLKHYTDIKKPLELTCTQQLQKSHRRSKKGSIPMVPLDKIKPKSASMRKKLN